MVGRPPKPVEQKELTGRAPGRDSGGRLLPETVVELPSAGGIPQIPEGLYTAPRAKTCAFLSDEEDPRSESGCGICAADPAVAVWREMWTQGQAWLSVQRDRRILERLCKAYVEEAHLRSALDEDGPFVKGQRGGLVAHPAVAMLRVLEQQITKWEGLCGFNPSDGGRLGVKVGKAKGASDAETILARRAARRAGRAAQRPARPGRAASGD
jgi:P27 family predicted phage terminase small subunit